MVKYICPRCKYVFTKKYDYEKHLEKKIKCTISDEEPVIPEDFKCKCGKSYSRQDTLKQHINKVHDGDETYNIGEQQNNGNSNNTIAGNKNNINQDNSVNLTVNIHNYDGMAKFGEDGVKFLTLEERLKIFACGLNAIEALILMVNLDDERYTHHNVGIIDAKSGYGFISDGKTWHFEKINVIIEVLLASKQKDLVEIADSIKDMLSDKDNEHIQKKINECRLIPLNRESVKTFTSCVKKHFLEKRHLAKNAMDVMGTYRTGNELLNKKTREWEFCDNFNLESGKKKLDQYLANQQQVEFYKDALKEVLQLYKTKGIVTQAEEDHVQYFVRDIKELYNIKKIIKIVTDKLIYDYQLTDRLSKLEAESKNRLPAMRDMLLLILNIYHERGTISADEKSFVETYCREITDPKDMEKTTSIVTRKIFEDYDLIDVLTKHSYTIEDKKDDDDGVIEI